MTTKPTRKTTKTETDEKPEAASAPERRRNVETDDEQSTNSPPHRLYRGAHATVGKLAMKGTRKGPKGGK